MLINSTHYYNIPSYHALDCEWFGGWDELKTGNHQYGMVTAMKEEEKKGEWKRKGATKK